MHDKVEVQMMQWYITHTCNLSCDYCFSFNNFKVNGNFGWNETKPYAEEWSKKVYCNDVTIIGGEPLIHPEINTWATELRKLFIDSEEFKICTNGTYLKKINTATVIGWYNLGIILEIHCHSDSHWNDVWLVLLDKFKDYKIDIVSMSGQPSLHDAEKKVYVDNKLACIIRKSKYFLPASIKSYDTEIKFYNTDPVISHNSCPIRECFYLVNGLMYKCGVIAAGSHLTTKLPFEERAKTLFNNYVPLSPYDNNVENLLLDLCNPVSACSLCPNFESVDDRSNLIEISPENTKISFK